MKKRKIQLMVICQIMALSLFAQLKEFTIEGTFRGKSNGILYITYPGENDKYVTDSILPKEGNFFFSGKLTGPVQGVVMMDKNPRYFDKYKLLYLIPGKMKLSIDYDNFSSSVLKGSYVQDEAEVLEKMKEQVNAKLNPLRAEYDRANNAYIEARRANLDSSTVENLKDKANQAKDAMEPALKELGLVEKAFMDKYPSSLVTGNMLRYKVGSMKFKEAEERFQKLPAEFKSTTMGKDIYKDIVDLKNGSPGAKAFEFASKELRGGNLALTDFRGKYVLVDFWASWCVPCRKGNPHLINLYSKYKAKGFEIIGVSDDDSNPDAWLKAVEKDQIGIWKHILRGLKRDPKSQYGFDKSSSISDKFGIHSLPTKVLIDPNGIIIGRYGGGGDDDEAMDKKLAEIFEK